MKNIQQHPSKITIKNELKHTMMYPYQLLLDFREVQFLPKLMQANEHIIQAVKGEVPSKNNGTGIAVLTNYRVIFLNHRLLWGSDSDSVLLSQIRGVSPDTGLLHGSISINTGDHNDSYFIHRLWKWHCTQFADAVQTEAEKHQNIQQQPNDSNNFGNINN